MTNQVTACVGTRVSTPALCAPPRIDASSGYSPWLGIVYRNAEAARERRKAGRQAHAGPMYDETTRGAVTAHAIIMHRPAGCSLLRAHQAVSVRAGLVPRAGAPSTRMQRNLRASASQQKRFAGNRDHAFHRAWTLASGEVGNPSAVGREGRTDRGRSVPLSLGIFR